MRRVLLGAAAALALVSVPAGGMAQPVSTQPLAGGEVLLEVNALGTDTRRADLAVLRFDVTGEGTDEAGARRAHAQALARVTTAARAAGAAAADIQAGPVGIEDSYDFDHAMTAMTTDDDGSAAVETSADPAAVKLARSSVVVRLRNVDAAAGLRTQLMAAGITSLMEPQYMLTDERAARRNARSDALTIARADAESYAASLGMRIVRVVRVSERLGWDTLGLGFSEWRRFERFFYSYMRQEPEVTTFVGVGVDFALAPQ